MPPTALVLAAVASVQIGSAVAKGLFDDLGPGGTVFLRALFAAVVLGLVWRPVVRGVARRDLLLVFAFGISLAGMNFAFYEALDRIPLGVAVTFEFAGPLGVAVVGSRTGLDFLWVAMAAAGILLLADPGGGGTDATGIALALLAGAFWGTYILLSARTGQSFSGGTGLALAMGVAAVVLVPFGVAQGGDSLLDPKLLVGGAAVAMLSSALPYSLELEALRSLPSRVFGVLMSLEPAMAALAGFAVLGQRLSATQLVAIALVAGASAGASRGVEEAAPRDA
jgi:inner membrane transporter RhtA